MASKFQRASTLSKNSTMLANTKINNMCPMKKSLYSASPGGEKNRWHKFQTKLVRCARRSDQGRKCGSEVGTSDHHVHRDTPPANGSDASFYVLPMTVPWLV
jgi:hypothetical protein